MQDFFRAFFFLFNFCIVSIIRSRKEKLTWKITQSCINRLTLFSSRLMFRRPLVQKRMCSTCSVLESSVIFLCGTRLSSLQKPELKELNGQTSIPVSAPETTSFNSALSRSGSKREIGIPNGKRILSRSHGKLNAGSLHQHVYRFRACIYNRTKKQLQQRFKAQNANHQSKRYWQVGSKGIFRDNTDIPHSNHLLDYRCKS